ncbi:hypothetical protein GCM10007979_04710 [Nocardioides albus]|nr:hypothetical protein GCM10007979_04710 [Nocardioides albus]
MGGGVEEPVKARQAFPAKVKVKKRQATATTAAMASFTQAPESPPRASAPKPTATHTSTPQMIRNASVAIAGKMKGGRGPLLGRVPLRDPTRFPPEMFVTGVILTHGVQPGAVEPESFGVWLGDTPCRRETRRSLASTEGRAYGYHYI